MQFEKISRDYLDWQVWVTVIFVLLAMTTILHLQGRLWICDCGYVLFWFGDAWGTETSQHLFDPYSFTHLSHGFIIYWLIIPFAHHIASRWQLPLAIALESLWEVFENTDFVIDHYREATAALGYRGDAIVNSLGDVIFCAIGFALAHKLGSLRTAIVFVLVEITLILTIKDSLLINLIMLVSPVEWIKNWQLNH